MAFDVTIYHNPACGTSRTVLSLIREAGYEPKVVEYLKVGWQKPVLEDIIKRSGLSARALLRERGTQAEALGLTDPKTSDAKILAAMLSDPALVNRPIVVTPKGAALCRPAELVRDLLEE
jgi:arsenate reductase